MSTQKFNVGDIVQLKSGGPKMTVSGEGAGLRDVQCQWFAGSKLEQGIFPTASLVVPEAKPSEAKKAGE